MQCIISRTHLLANITHTGMIDALCNHIVLSMIASYIATLYSWKLSRDEFSLITSF